MSAQHRGETTDRRRNVAGRYVGRVARAQGVNENQVFYWHKLYQAGRLGGSSAAQLLPVFRVRRGRRQLTESRSSASHRTVRAQVRIEGNAAGPVLVRVLQRSILLSLALAVGLAKALSALVLFSSFLPPSWMTEKLGVHARFGAFVAEVMPKNDRLLTDLVGRIESLSLDLLFPLFFAADWPAHSR